MCIKIQVKAVFFLRWKYLEFNTGYWEKNFLHMQWKFDTEISNSVPTNFAWVIIYQIY